MSDFQGPPVEIHTVLFRPDGYVEVTYAEREDLTADINVIRTIVLSRERFLGDIQDLEVNIAELVDEGLLALRLDREKRREA